MFPKRIGPSPPRNTTFGHPRSDQIISCNPPPLEHSLSSSRIHGSFFSRKFERVEKVIVVCSAHDLLLKKIISTQRCPAIYSSLTLIKHVWAQCSVRIYDVVTNLLQFLHAGQLSRINNVTITTVLDALCLPGPLEYLMYMTHVRLHI